MASIIGRLIRNRPIDQISSTVLASCPTRSLSSGSNPIRATLFPGDGIGPEIAASVKQLMKSSDEDIVEMIFFPVVNEACRILAEGIAAKSSDLDIASVMGMGFPPYRGGVMFWADSYGSKYICSRLDAWTKTYGDFFKPCAYLAERAAQGTSLVIKRVRQVILRMDEKCLDMYSTNVRDKIDDRNFIIKCHANGGEMAIMLHHYRTPRIKGLTLRGPPDRRFGSSDVAGNWFLSMMGHYFRPGAKGAQIVW